MVFDLLFESRFLLSCRKSQPQSRHWSSTVLKVKSGVNENPLLLKADMEIDFSQFGHVIKKHRKNTGCKANTKTENHFRLRLR